MTPISSRCSLPELKRLAERILTESQVQAIIALTSGRRDHILLRLLYGSGVRVAELCALKWNDVQPNGESGQISVFGKGGKTRWIVLPPSLWQVLITFRGESPDTAPIFPSRKHGGHLDSSQVLRIVRAAAKRAGIPKNVSPHCFGHCHATHALHRGSLINFMAATLGHYDVSVSTVCLHARPNESSGKYLAL